MGSAETPSLKVRTWKVEMAITCVVDVKVVLLAVMVETAVDVLASLHLRLTSTLSQSHSSRNHATAPVNTPVF